MEGKSQVANWQCIWIAFRFSLGCTRNKFH